MCKLKDKNDVKNYKHNILSNNKNQAARRLMIFFSFSVITSGSLLEALASLSACYSQSTISFLCLDICSFTLFSYQSLANKLLLIFLNPDSFYLRFSVKFKQLSGVIVPWILRSLIYRQIILFTDLNGISNFFDKPYKDMHKKQFLFDKM